MRHFKLRIIRVDHDGYNGRDYHPADSDIGLVVVPLLMSGYWTNEDGDFQPLIIANMEQALDQEHHEMCWLCATTDGRTLELMSHELELVLEVH